MSLTEKETYSVLVADDSEDDRFLLRTAMPRAARLRLVGEVSNGLEVISYLRGQADFSNRVAFPMPDLLLLDLKMPLKDGFEVLQWLNARDFQDLVVVVLTDSMQPEHLKKALDLGADLFQVKPRAIVEREAMVLALEDYLIKLPRAMRANVHALSQLAG